MWDPSVPFFKAATVKEWQSPLPYGSCSDLERNVSDPPCLEVTTGSEKLLKDFYICRQDSPRHEALKKEEGYWLLRTIRETVTAVSFGIMWPRGTIPTGCSAIVAPSTAFINKLSPKRLVVNVKVNESQF